MWLRELVGWQCVGPSAGRQDRHIEMPQGDAIINLTVTLCRIIRLLHSHPTRHPNPAVDSSPRSLKLARVVTTLPSASRAEAFRTSVSPDDRNGGGERERDGGGGELGGAGRRPLRGRRRAPRRLCLCPGRRRGPLGMPPSFQSLCLQNLSLFTPILVCLWFLIDFFICLREPRKPYTSVESYFA